MRNLSNKTGNFSIDPGMEEKGSFRIVVYGKPGEEGKKEFYKDLLDEFTNQEPQIEDKFTKTIISEFLSYTEMLEEQVDSYRPYRYTKEDIEAYEQINDTLRDELEKQDRENKALKRKYENLSKKYTGVKNFIVYKIGKIPVIGKRVLKMLEQDISEKSLENGTGEEQGY